MRRNPLNDVLKKLDEAILNETPFIEDDLHTKYDNRKASEAKWNYVVSVASKWFDTPEGKGKIEEDIKCSLTNPIGKEMVISAWDKETNEVQLTYSLERNNEDYSASVTLKIVDDTTVSVVGYSGYCILDLDVHDGDDGISLMEEFVKKQGIQYKDGFSTIYDACLEAAYIFYSKEHLCDYVGMPAIDIIELLEYIWREQGEKPQNK